MPDYLLPENEALRPYRIDVTLTALREVAESGSSVPVTLSISGSVVTGMLISGQRYFEQIADRMERAQPSKGANEKVVEIVDGWRMLAKELASLTPHSEQARAAGDHLHVEGAKLISGARTFPAEGMLWRIRVSDVSGWSIGAYG